MDVTLYPRHKEINEFIGLAARYPVTTLITGETGTGKEFVADIIHAHSARKGQPFEKLNCANFTDSMLEAELFGHVKGAFTGAHANKTGLIEACNGGTILLDEIGDMSLPLQAKILRFVQNKEIRAVGATHAIKVDVRLIAATRRDLPTMIQDGGFRDDLFYRLNEFSYELPALRHRMHEVEPLAEQFLVAALRELSRAPLKMSTGARGALHAYHWPGNIRELRNQIRTACIWAGGSESIEASNFRFLVAPEAPGCADRKRTELMASLLQCGGNVSALAEKRNVARTTIYRQMEKLGIERVGI
jgi:transcriptional regulator with PAS, ATPase and Fis domain